MVKFTKSKKKQIKKSKKKGGAGEFQIHENNANLVTPYHFIYGAKVKLTDNWNRVMASNINKKKNGETSTLFNEDNMQLIEKIVGTLLSYNADRGVAYVKWNVFPGHSISTYHFIGPRPSPWYRFKNKYLASKRKELRYLTEEESAHEDMLREQELIELRKREMLKQRKGK